MNRIFYVIIILLAACGKSAEKSVDSPVLNDKEKMVDPGQKKEVKQESQINKDEFDIKLLIEADGDKYYDPESEFYYNVGYDNEVYFVPGDKPVVKIPGWDLLISENAVEFKKAKTPNKAPLNYKMDEKLDTFHVKVIDTGMACDDTRENKVIIENAKQYSVIEKLAKVAIFKNCIGNKQELYIVSYHQCLLPDLKIHRIRCK